MSDKTDAIKQSQTSDIHSPNWSKIAIGALIRTILWCVVVYLLISVVPPVKMMFEEFGVDLPSLTQLLMSFSDRMSAFWYVVLIAISMYFGVDAFLQHQVVGIRANLLGYCRLPCCCYHLWPSSSSRWD